MAMTPCSTLIRSHALGLEVGATSVEEVKKWADEFIVSHGYDDRVADISLLTKDTSKEAHSMLLSLSPEADDWNALRLLAPRLLEVLEEVPTRLHDLTRFFEKVCYRNGFDWPKDFNFLIGIEDQFLLAEQGSYGTIEDVRTEVVDGLKNLIT